MMFPPTSGRKAVRIGNAASISALSDSYGFLMSTWISNRIPEGDGDQQPTPASWLPEFRNRLLAQAEKINILRGMTQLARWEGSIRGSWPVEEYTRLVDVQSDMISSLAHVSAHRSVITELLLFSTPSWEGHLAILRTIGGSRSCIARKY